ncbi:MAG: HAD-IC family P-type ATPase [Parcubacteria group bacterium]|nr:HAD-IC family P-type ATPase [Parcubacteria group bacterium]
MNEEHATPWHAIPKEEIAFKLMTDLKNGLTEKEVARRLERHGPNLIVAGRKKTVWKRIAIQFKNPLLFILLAAGVVTIFLGAFVDFTVIAIAVIINAAIGVFQEEKADNAFAKLAESQVSFTIVVRDEKRRVIPSTDIVPGDVIILEPGMTVPADCRIISTKNILLNEAPLTGEWLPVAKKNLPVSPKAALTEKKNMVWKGTLVVSGTASVVVVATGGQTEFGAIAKALDKQKSGLTPLERSMRHVARLLSFVALAVLVIIFIAGIWRGQPISEMFLLSVALAVAVVPEGLPAAVTVVLAFGMESILKRRGLVKNLLAAETLGSTTVILTDKTGTITEARMRLKSITAYSSLRYDAFDERRKKDERDILDMAILSSGAFIEGDPGLSATQIKEEAVRGTPVERAILIAGLYYGITPALLAKKRPTVDTLEFQSQNRFSAAIIKKEDGKRRLYATGAPELFLKKATAVYKNGRAVEMTTGIRQTLEQQLQKMSGAGFRIVASGYVETTRAVFPQDARIRAGVAPHLLESLVFGGFFAFYDPIRGDVKEAITTVQKAGARVIMITGDQAITAHQIAEETGIDGREDTLSGDEIDALTDEELGKRLDSSNVLARFLPHQKLRVVELLRKKGEVVAMTGDGINDAPALRAAHIGLALGSGTDVAKEASDIILLDNGFGVIAHAIEEGRRILDNLKKITIYLLSTNFSEIFVIAISLFIGAPLPILPTQILWTNIVEEGFMNFAFAFEPAESDLMMRNPRASHMKYILTPRIRKIIFAMGLITGSYLVMLYLTLLMLELPIEKIRTLVFAAVSIDSIFFSLSLKNLHSPIWRINLFNNKYLLGALAFSVCALLLALFFEPLQILLSLVQLSILDMVLILGIGFLNLFTIELLKYRLFGKGH